jgi:hypothetical protein
MSTLEIAMSLSLGVALAAAVGLRVFIPLLAVSVAAHFGKLQLSDTFQWLATAPAMFTFAVAAVVEVGAYYLPGVDNLLDMLTTPLALIAGTMMVAAPLIDVPPVLKWTLAVIAGGGAAGVTQGLSAMLRAKSTLATGGLANPVVSTGELGGAVVLSGMALLVPVLALVLVAVAMLLAFRFVRRLARK